MALPSLALPCRPRSLCSHTPLLRANAITSFNHNFVTRLSDCYRVRPPIVTSASVPQPFATTAGLFLSSRKSPVKAAAVNEGACNRAVRHATAPSLFSLASLLKIGRNNERGARKEGERESFRCSLALHLCVLRCARAASRRPLLFERETDPPLCVQCVTLIRSTVSSTIIVYLQRARDRAPPATANLPPKSPLVARNFVPRSNELAVLQAGRAVDTYYEQKQRKGKGEGRPGLAACRT